MNLSFADFPYPLPPRPIERYDLAGIRDNTRSFSDRQWAILAWVGHGCTNSQIAETCRVSVKTIEAEMTQILRTLSVGSRIEAAVVWTLLHGEWPPQTPGTRRENRELPH